MVAVINTALIFCLALATTLSAQIKIEIGLVPITLQTAIVLLSGLVFGSRIGAASQLFYLTAGLIGIPWFSHGGGINYIFSPTFGYIIGFVAAAYTVGKLAELMKEKKILNVIGAMLGGELVIYFFGLLWLTKFLPWQTVLSTGLYPFIPGDLLKIALVGAIFSFVKKIKLQIQYER